MDQIGVEAVGRYKNFVPPGEGRSESGVGNWTGEDSTKTLRDQATLTDRGRKSQGWHWVCVGHGSSQQAGREILDCRGYAPSGGKKCVPINKNSVDETLSNLPLQGGQALTCGDGEQEEVLRDEERRVDMAPGCVVPGGRGAVQREVGRAQATF